MSSILYYSNFCDKSKSLLQRLAKSKIKEGIHYMCIDKRVKGENGAWYIVMEDGQQIILPPHVNRVPALLLLNQNHAVLYGDQITNHLKPMDVQQNNVATGFNGEPSPFSTGSEFMGGFGVISDNYSFLDQSSDDLSAKGSGGLRQLYNYATIDFNQTIECPAIEEKQARIGPDVTLEKLEKERNAQIMQSQGQQGQHQQGQPGFQQQQQQHQPQQQHRR
jgi:hypothetical protein